MKKLLAKLMAFVLAFAVMMPVAAQTVTPIVASAATVSLAATKKTVIVGNTYTITLKNSSSVKKSSWKSSDTTVATVNGKGVVTAKAAGTAKITCTATLDTGKQQTLTCTITVKKRVAATSVSLNSVHDKINAHFIEVGGNYDFNTKLTPSNSTDSTYYRIADADIASVNTAGVVTGKKAGITVLEARIGLNKTEANKATNKVVARTYIYVTPKAAATPTPTPTPAAAPKATGVTMVSSKEISIAFNTEILKSSVIDSNGDLIKGAISVVSGTNATDYGTLSAKLSADLKSISLTSTGEFDGTYVVTIFNKVMTMTNEFVEAESFQVDFKDTVGPMYLNSTIDDNGYLCKINFNEALDISSLQIITVTGTNDTAVKGRLNAVSSYTLSEDRKSLVVDLSNMGIRSLDAMVGMVGIKDLKGNASAQYQMNVLVQIDGTEKPLAQIVNVERTSKSVLTATFDRAIQYAGYAVVEGSIMNGTVDSKDNKKVNYTIGNTAITGVKAVQFSGWFNYNVVSATGNTRTMNVNFTLDSTPPQVTGYDLHSSSLNGISGYALDVTFSKDIAVTNASGTIATLVNSVNGNIGTQNYTYTASASGKVLTLNFLAQTFDNGTYTFTLPAGIVIDSLENASKVQLIKIVKSAGSSSQLPAPVTVIQDSTNPSKIIVTFANKLDLETAQTAANYMVNGSITPLSATITSQSESSAVVELLFNSSSFMTSGAYTMTIQGIKGFNGAYAQMKEYNTVLTLVENTGANVTSCKLTSSTTIVITLTKDVTGTGEFMYYGNNGLTSVSSVFSAGNQIYLSLPDVMTQNTYVIVVNNGFKDNNNNTALLPTQMNAVKSY